MIYFDNAATTYPKPKEVIQTVEKAIKECGGNPGRGSHILSDKASLLVYETREALADLFDAESENISFTMNATYALNMAVKGLAKPHGKILLDNFAHNASFRPALATAKEQKGTLAIYDASGSDEQTLFEIEKQIEAENTVVIATHQSNICSKVLPIARIGKLCRLKKCPFIVDASQSAGHIPISVKEYNITSLCLPGHKGLFGIMGSGVLVSSTEATYRTILEGGSGVFSLEEEMPNSLPERMEAGTLPLAAIASMKAGAEFIKNTGIDNIDRKEKILSERLTKGLSKIKGIKTHGKTGGSVISFTAEGISNADIGNYMNDNNICVRVGYHCAPVAHRTLGTIGTGTVRIGFSYMNTEREVDRFLDLLDHFVHSNK